MNLLKPLLTALVVLPALLQAQSPAYVSLSDAVRRPAENQYIEITPVKSDIDKWKKNSSRLSAVRGVKIRDGNDDAQFASLFQSLSGNKELRTLELSFNTIQVMPEAIKGLKQLEEVIVWGNDQLNYEDFFTKLSTLPRLKKLELNGSMLEHMPASVTSLQNLGELSLGANDLLDLQETVNLLRGMPALKHLRLEVYGLDELPKNLQSLAQISQMDIDILREDENSDVRNNDDRLYVENFTLARSSDPAHPLQVKCTSSVSPLTSDERASVRSLDFASGPVTLQYINGMASNSAPFNKQYNFIKPPLAGMDVPRTVYTLEANAGGSLIYPTGTTVRVPADAFVDAQGNTVTGPVKVDYREFRDPVDFIMSGIPMTYDSGGVTNHFQSAGMFEINASAGGQEVFLASGKNISLDFAITDSAEKYSFYSFNDTIGNWKNIGNSGTTRNAENQALTYSRALSDAWKAYNTWKNGGYIKYKDTVAFADRFESENYFYTKRMFNRKRDGFVETVNKKHVNNGKFKNRNLVRLKRVKSENKGEICFTLDYWSSKHPELTSFSGVKWVLQDNMTTAQFRKKFNSKAQFSDIRIENDGDEEFTMKLKGKDGITELHAKPHMKAKNAPIAQFKRNYAWRYRSYKRYLSRREKQFNRALKKDRTMQYVNYPVLRRDSVTAWNMINSMMSPEEKNMSRDQWMNYYNDMVSGSRVNSNSFAWQQQSMFGMYKRSKWKTAVNVAGGILATTLTIATLGVFNCDCIYPGLDPYKDNSVNVFAMYITEDGQQLPVETTYILNRSYNGMLTYQNQSPGRGHNVRYGKVKGNVMLSLAPDGSVYYFAASDFKDTDVKGGPFTFRMHASPKKVNTAEELRQMVYDDKLYKE